MSFATVITDLRPWLLIRKICTANLSRAMCFTSNKFSNSLHLTAMYIVHQSPSSIWDQGKGSSVQYSQSLRTLEKPVLLAFTKFKIQGASPLWAIFNSPKYWNFQTEDIKAEQFQQLWQILAFVKKQLPGAVPADKLILDHVQAWTRIARASQSASECFLRCSYRAALTPAVCSCSHYSFTQTGRWSCR